MLKVKSNNKDMENNNNKNLDEKLNDILDSNISQDEKLDRLSNFIDMFGNEYINKDKNDSNESDSEYNNLPEYNEDEDCYADNLDYEDDDNYDVPSYEEEDHYMDDVEMKVMARPKFREYAKELVNKYDGDKEGLINEIAEIMLSYEF